MEQWKTCVYNGEVFFNYEVSTEGRVRSLGNDKTRKTKLLKPNKKPNGYLDVALSKNGKKKKCYIQKLVAEAFIPNPNNYGDVNHINENKQDNRVENLEWCDRKYNINHGTRTERCKKTWASKKNC